MAVVGVRWCDFVVWTNDGDIRDSLSPLNGSTLMRCFGTKHPSWAQVLLQVRYCSRTFDTPCQEVEFPLHNKRLYTLFEVQGWVSSV